MNIKTSQALSQIAQYFKNDPVNYAKIVLGVRLTADQEKILNLLTIPPKKVLVKAGHNTGKTFLAAVAALWHYDCFNPGIVLTTAPTERQVKNVLWKEIRTLRGRWGGILPASCLLQDSPHHFLFGFTARDDARFQGHHEENVFVIFDEAVGVESCMWEAAETMFTTFLGIYNPTDQSSYAYTAERSGNYHVVSLSALNHPNIEAELKGQPAPFPSAIRLGRLDAMVRQWCEPCQEQPLASDLQWPPGSGQWRRPSPVAEARLLGRWPTSAFNSIWTEALFEKCCNSELPDDGPVQIGADIARFGDDDTVIAVRKGRCSILQEAHNGWSTWQTATRLRQLSDELGQKYSQKPKNIVIAIDDAGAGGGVVDQAEGYNFVPINAASKPNQPEMYNMKRSELWFDLADEATAGNVSFNRLPKRVQDDLRNELLAPTYSLDYQGRRVVEPKKDTKKRIGRSPDNADALHLSFAKPRFEQHDKVIFK